MGSQTILVVDDEWAIAELVGLLLAGEGYRVRHAGDGWEALEVLEHPPVDLVLTDLMMPVLDGAGLVRKMRQIEGLSKLPVLVMSALPLDAMYEMCPSAAGYVGKPFRSGELLAAVRRVLPQEQGVPT